MRNDPGNELAKAVVFSTWPALLQLVSEGLSGNGVQAVSVAVQDPVERSTNLDRALLPHRAKFPHTTPELQTAHSRVTSCGEIPQGSDKFPPWDWWQPSGVKALQ